MPAWAAISAETKHTNTMGACVWVSAKVKLLASLSSRLALALLS